VGLRPVRPTDGDCCAGCYWSCQNTVCRVEMADDVWRCQVGGGRQDWAIVIGAVCPGDAVGLRTPWDFRGVVPVVCLVLDVDV
jgi:hypothetical protein